MEITLQKNKAIKIKTKNVTLSLDDDIDDASIVIYTSYDDPKRAQEMGYSNQKLIIKGPGEYEMQGVQISGKSHDSHASFEVVADGMKLLILRSTNLDTLEEGEDYNAVLVYCQSEVGDTILSHVSASLLILHGEEDKIRLNTANIKKVQRVNLRKKEEFTGSAVVLSLS